MENSRREKREELSDADIVILTSPHNRDIQCRRFSLLGYYTRLYSAEQKKRRFPDGYRAFLTYAIFFLAPVALSPPPSPKSIADTLQTIHQFSPLNPLFALISR